MSEAKEMPKSIWEVRLVEMKQFEDDEVPTKGKIRAFRQISEEKAEKILRGDEVVSIVRL